MSTETGQFHSLWKHLQETGALAYAIPYAPDYDINGLSRVKLTRLAATYAGREPGPLLPYIGGEFIALDGENVRRVSQAAQDLWPCLLARHARGETNFPEEAHMLSYLWWYLELPNSDASTYVKRIWTQWARTRTGKQSDLVLPLWHVPAEKRYGLRRLFSRLSRDGVEQWSSIDNTLWLRMIGRELGIPKNSRVKVIRDVAFAAASRGLDRLPPSSRW